MIRLLLRFASCRFSVIRLLSLALIMSHFVGCVRVTDGMSNGDFGLTATGEQALEEFYQSARHEPGSDEHFYFPNIEVPKEPEVLRMVHHYTKKDREYVTQGLERLNTFGELLREEIIKRNMPLELLNLAFAESCFKQYAKSHAGAAGIWQFMPATARAYGLRVSRFFDDRYSPEMATRAAVDHLQDLYKDFGDWKLAMAAYNAGPGRIRKSMKKTGSKDFFTLARSGLLKKETSDYVPKILALTHITRNLKAYGFLGEQD